MPTSTLITLMFTIIMDVMGLGLVLPLLPNLVVAPGSPFYGCHALFFYGVVLAIWSLGTFFGSPFLGAFSDKIGRKKILVVALLSNALIYAFSAVTILQKWFLGFVFMRLGSGFFSGSFELAQAAVADKSNEEAKAKDMSYMILAFAIGSIVGPFLSSIALPFGLVVPFLLASALSLINVICLSLFFKETHVRKEHKLELVKLITAFTFFFRDLRIRNLGMVFLLFQFAWGFYFSSIPLVMQEVYHFVPEQLSYFFIVLGIGFAIVPLFLQQFMMRYFSLSKIAFLGLVVSAIFISLSFFLKFFVEIQWLTVFVFAVFESLAFSSLLAMLSNKVSSEEQGKMMGGCGSLYSIAFIVIGLSVGILSSFFIWTAILISSVFFILSGLLLQYLENKATK